MNHLLGTIWSGNPPILSFLSQFGESALNQIEKRERIKQTVGYPKKEVLVRKEGRYHLGKSMCCIQHTSHKRETQSLKQTDWSGLSAARQTRLHTFYDVSKRR